jgi:hypothetical protein
MPQRPPSFAERLRAALGSDVVESMAPARTAPARHAQPSKGSDFADRLRAALAARNASRL